MLRALRLNFRRSLFIRTEPTPNPNSLIFRPEKRTLLEQESKPVCNSICFTRLESTVEFTSALEAARKSPLADELFKIDGVKSVLLGHDFLTVTKGAGIAWPQLNPQIYAAIMDFFTTGQPVIKDASKPEPAANESEVVQMIREILDSRIRPTIQEDGGDVEFRGFDAQSGWVKLKLVGACRTCSSSTITLRNGIESMLMHYIPEVKGVEQVLDEEEAVARKTFEQFEAELESKKKKE